MTVLALQQGDYRFDLRVNFAPQLFRETLSQDRASGSVLEDHKGRTQLFAPECHRRDC